MRSEDRCIGSFLCSNNYWHFRKDSWKLLMTPQHSSSAAPAFPIHPCPQPVPTHSLQSEESPNPPQVAFGDAEIISDVGKHCLPCSVRPGQGSCMGVVKCSLGSREVTVWRHGLWRRTSGESWAETTSLTREPTNRASWNDRTWQPSVVRHAQPLRL